MNKYENLLVTVAEECAEISEVTSKSLRFGLENHHPCKPDVTNAQEIMKEYYHLAAMIDLLQGVGKLPILSEDEIDKIKSDKLKSITYYQDVSMQCGTLTESEDNDTKEVPENRLYKYYITILSDTGISSMIMDSPSELDASYKLIRATRELEENNGLSNVVILSYQLLKE